MRKILTLGAFVAILSGLALAETYNGRLLDASCLEQQKNACDPTNTTVSFAMFLGGKVYRLDDAGNSKAVEALKNRADRSKDPSMPSNQITAKVSGTMEDGILKVETIEVQ